MNNLNYEELKIILGFYYFYDNRINDKSLKKFTDQFNYYFKKDLSTQSILYSMSIFKNLDTRFIAHPVVPSNENYSILWDYYIIKDRIKDLKKEFLVFSKSKAIKEIVLNLSEDDYQNEINNRFFDLSYNFIEDKPKKLYEVKESENKTNQKRDLNVAFNALKDADFKCEIDKNHETFIRKNIAINYTEGHHLVPLSYQYKFDVNLDVEANIVSLCSNCHNKIHYGRDYSELLKCLYNQRKKRLEKCGIFISFEELLKMYD